MAEMNRRGYLKAVAGAVGGLTVLPACVRRSYAANEKVNVGVIGAGIGAHNARKLTEFGENVAVLCDVDRRRLDHWGRDYPQARRYQDFRLMLEKEKLDGIVVATPDHTHAFLSITAMRQGVHCFCQKPLTQTIHEARLMAQVAAETKTVTQIGTDTCTGLAQTQVKALLESDVLGDVREVHVWTDRPIWPQGFGRPEGSDPVPDTLDWDLWLGPAPLRHFRARWPDKHPVYSLPEAQRKSQVYHPFVWRGWWEFGTGALGDIASHSLNQVFWNLDLGAPESVEVVEAAPATEEMYPLWSVLRLNFPARGSRGPVSILWYDGGKRPPEEIAGVSAPGGVVYMGTKNSYPRGRGPFRGDAYHYELPKGEFSRRDDIHRDWCDGIRTGRRPAGHFGWSGPLTEAILLGNLALRVRRKLHWDAAAMRVTNCPEANAFIKRTCRKGWEL
ncbi:MAG: Gfo/Idh/MocA family oxidoreductase [Lentisphaeria bacterium]|nr:Gfo/Idh/MocA family oxidoreductase [Lentisphaeria bacterium]